MKNIRGSIKTEQENIDAIAEEVAALLRRLMDMNRLTAENLRSVLIGATDDLPGGFSKRAMEKAGLDAVPLFSVQQFRYQSGMDRCIQVIFYPKAGAGLGNDLLLGCESWGDDR